MMFLHGPRQLLVLIISVMLITKYCFAIFGQLVPIRILPPQNRRIADYYVATFRTNFRIQRRHKKLWCYALALMLLDILYAKIGPKVILNRRFWCCCTDWLTTTMRQGNKSLVATGHSSAGISLLWPTHLSQITMEWFETNSWNSLPTYNTDMPQTPATQ